MAEDVESVDEENRNEEIPNEIPETRKT